MLMLLPVLYVVKPFIPDRNPVSLPIFMKSFQMNLLSCKEDKNPIPDLKYAVPTYFYYSSLFSIRSYSLDRN